VRIVDGADAEHGGRLRVGVTLSHALAVAHIVCSVAAAVLNRDLLQVEVVAALACRAFGKFVAVLVARACLVGKALKLVFLIR